ncbi:MAG: hypothetical protein JXB07_00155 [Anaerolineae bacterium]|nr:hypothetical protein [Anaerolineae bacterium]
MIQQELNTKLTIGGLCVYVLAYTGWLITMSIGLASVFYTRHVIDMVWRAMGALAGIDPVIVTTRVRCFDRIGTPVMLLLWTVFAFYAEYRYRSSVDAAKRRQFRQGIDSYHPSWQPSHLRDWGIDILTRRFLMITSIPIIIFAIAYLVQEITIGRL